MSRLLLILTLALPALAGDFVDGFEDDLNTDGLPDGWRRYSDNRTHPVYNPIELVEDAAHVREGHRAIRLATMDRNVSLVSAVPSPVLSAVDPRKGYSFSVWAMTEGLTASRAFATIEWLDRLGAPLVPPRKQKTDVTAARTWTLLDARFESVPKEARFVRFGLHVEGSDLSGSAWFDDLIWREEIRIRVANLDRKGFVVHEGQAARIEASCEDLEPGEYELALWAHEYDGRDVPLSLEEGEERVLRVGSAGDRQGQPAGARHPVHVGGLRDFQARYRIEGMPTGFLELVFSLRREGEEVARRRVGFFSPPDAFLSPLLQSDWGVELKPETDLDIVDRLGEIHLGRARVLLWDGSPEREAELARSGAADDLLYRLTQAGTTISGSLATPPVDLLSEGGSALGMGQFLAGSQASWAPALENEFKRYRESIREWRLGGTGGREFEGRLGLDGLVKPIGELLARDLPNVGVTLPLPISDAKNGVAQLATAQTLRGIDFYLPGDTDPDAAKTLLDEVKLFPEAASVTIGLGELVTGDAGASFPEQAGALWRLAGLATHRRIRRLSVSELVSSRAGLFDLDGTPTPLQGAYWMAHNALAAKDPLDMEGRRAIWYRESEKEPERGIEQLVFRRGDRTVVLAWLADGGAAIDVPLHLGHDVKALRVDGRVLPLVPGEDGVKRVTLGREPVLLYDIDQRLFDTLRTLTFDPPVVFSESSPQKVLLRFTNKFLVPLAIKDLAIDYPEHWKDSRLTWEEVPPGGEAKLEVPLWVPESQNLGVVEFGVVLSIRAGKDYDGLQAGLHMEVKSESGAKLELIPRWTPGALEVEVRLENGDRRSSYVLSLGMGEGIPVKTDVTETLDARKPWTKTYKFPASDALVDRTIRVKLNEPQATTFLSAIAKVPPRR